MNKEKTLLVLWILFGYVFIQAVDSVLYFLINLIFFGTVTIGIPFSILNFLIPIISILLYLAAVLILLKKLKNSSLRNEIRLTVFPKKYFLISLILAFFLDPITNKLSGIFTVYIDSLENISTSGYLEFYGWFHSGIGAGKVLSLIILSVIFLKRYNLKE